MIIMKSDKLLEAPSLIRLRCGFTQNDWGKIGSESLVFQLSNSNKVDQNAPYAELWMGSHDLHPSQDYETREWLRDIFQSHPSLLSRPIDHWFNRQLPFLFKVLSIESAICIQAHPDKTLAKQLHMSDPITYPEQEKDSHHKPEMIVALTPFEALCGFRPFPEIASFLAHLSPLRRLIGTPAHEFMVLASQGTSDSLQEIATVKRAWEALLRAPQEQIVACTRELLILVESDEIHQLAGWEVLRGLITRLHRQYPDDVGLFTIFFMNYVSLAPGKALFVSPNELHSYLSGDAVECMASSANVVRGGFTRKQKDIDTLISMASYSCSARVLPRILPHNPHVVSTRGAVSSVLYQTPAEEFDVAKIDLRSHDAQIQLAPIHGPSIVICIQGRGEIHAGNQMGDINHGSVFFIGAGNAASMRNNTAGSDLVLFQALCDSRGL
ncbi:hypothetical protein FE257_001430 [Aspergillus nanangensis]|uniref:Mannose-6-phosphate isomerase n=1 Tax=Aspergillus nanangensis TaxID=2582783 RepID=A0AAD4GQQ1_ASPNN|nr:hypothetical protein FE257_001430 [Aspergillus nanangensis]